MLNLLRRSVLAKRKEPGRELGHATPEILDQDSFLDALSLEQRRTERSHRRFVLMLVDFATLLAVGDSRGALKKFLGTLAAMTRETDITGWYKRGTTIGVIFTEIGDADGKLILNALLNKVSDALSSTLSIEQVDQIQVSFHVFPEDAGKEGERRPISGRVLNPDRTLPLGKRAGFRIKRAIDIGGSLFALLVLSPVFALIALAVKLTSHGPILFRQERLGQYGRKFTFLKFRSMYSGNHHAIHEEFVKRLITEKNGNVFKIVDDPRVTPVGRFLRKTSLDELPQFLNVLKGEMSIVGPRPPIPYEVRCYDLWHRRRLLSVKPGITGLWQVEGRSRVGFDEMVRLDLQYARTWSLWLDLKILLQTPRAVLSGEGAV